MLLDLGVDQKVEPFPIYQKKGFHRCYRCFPDDTLLGIGILSLLQEICHMNFVQSFQT